ncbi:MAG: amidohydrolase family protein [Candidatus Hydrothermarchaeota archaeon]
MKRKRINLGLILVFGILVLFFSNTFIEAEEELNQVWAIKDCRIVPMSGSVIEKGVVVIRQGLIDAVGTNIDIPADAEIIDGAKLTVYPGLMDSLGKSFLKLPEQKFDSSKFYTGKFTDQDRGLTPELKAFDYVEFGKTVLEKFRKFGFTSTQVMPDRGILTGQASVFSLSDSDKNKALLLKDSALGIGFSAGVFGTYPSSLMGIVAYLRQTFSDTAYFNMHSQRWKKEMIWLTRPVYDPKLETLTDFVVRRKPIIFLCRNQNDIKRAINLGQEFKLNYFICDLGGEAFRVIPKLKQAKARLLLTVRFKAPATSIYAQKGREEREKAEKELYPKNPAKMAEAGIPFAFSSLGIDDPEKMIEGVMKAIENGMSHEKALQALTIIPASFLGFSKALGTIEPGKIANLVLTEGDILTKEAKVRYVFTDGKKFEIKEKKVEKGKEPTVNVTGRWELSVETGMGAMTMTVEFFQEGSSLSGKMTTQFGVFEFTEGTVSGNEISFDMVISVAGQEIDLYFSAMVENDTMTGTVIQGTMGSAEFTGKRIP